MCKWFLNFIYDFLEVNVDVSYDGNHNFNEFMNKSKPESNGSSKNAILTFLVFVKFVFSFADKTKIIPLAIFSLLVIL